MPLVYPLRPMLVPPRLTAEPGAADDLSSSPHKWTFAHSTPALRGPTSPLALVDGCAIDGQGQSPQWSETDFPPLHGFNELMQHSARWIEPREIPEVDEHSEKATSDSPSSLSVQPATPVPPRQSNSVGGEDTQGDSTNPDRHVQELTIPPTPEYSVSPLTPITPRTGSSFPRTPQSAYMRGPGVRVNDGSLVEVENANTVTPRKGAYYGYHAHGGEEVSPAEERYLDPLTVFVGGLEMFGPHAWDEGRLWELFGKYGEVENVQLVKPPNKKSAFSFVRFRSAEASSRAVAAEHNRIHDGRQIRVQLRDTNHQRSPWKLMRGRGRINNFAPPPRLYSETSGEAYGTGHPPPFHYSEQRNNPGDHGDRMSPSNHGLSSVGSADSMVTADSATVFGDPSDPKALSSNHADSLRGSGQLDIQRSQSANTHPSASTTPSSMGYPPPAGPMPQYTMPPMGYFPPQWMHAYPSSYPYAVPFMPGYMGFAPPMPQGSNSGEVAAAMQPGYRPYPPPNGEYTQHHGYPPLVSHVGTQPPLRATGFIQGEHDTLIPVYQPEALTQYMSETSQNAPIPGRQNESRHPTPPAYPPTASAGSQPTPVWQPYPHMSMYPYVYHPPPMLPHHGQAPVNAAHPGPAYNGWAPTPYPVSQGPQMHGSQAPASHPPQLHLTPPPYGIPTPVSAQAPPHRLPPTSPRYPSQQAYGPQNSTPGAKRYSRRDGFAGNGGRPGNFNNRSLSQGNRPGARRSPNHDQGYQAMWRPNVHS
ncbi:hypothetical protein QCA50_002536 [Cerrena zonata]|uniref:RRM domain-containing protein n=1 Tax=Cerrena zonata TaxID=2478898 RepID=A0AAW0GVL7_9APHY